MNGAECAAIAQHLPLLHRPDFLDYARFSLTQKRVVNHAPLQHNRSPKWLRDVVVMRWGKLQQLRGLDYESKDRHRGIVAPGAFAEGIHPTLCGAQGVRGGRGLRRDQARSCCLVGRSCRRQPSFAGAGTLDRHDADRKGGRRLRHIDATGANLSSTDQRGVG